MRELRPTHLIVNVDENRRDVVDAARAFVPHVVVTHPNDPSENLRLYALFGSIFGREREAAALADDLTAAMAEADIAARRLPRERVLYVIWRKPWMTVSRPTYISATLARVGWDTLPAHAETRYPELADDAQPWHDAQRILLSTEPFAFTRRDAQALAQRWRKPVELVDGEWTSWYGPRAIAGLRALTHLRAALATGIEKGRP